jgi:hypothetical protein
MRPLATRAFALGAFALALVLAAGACSEVIGLGPEPSREGNVLPGACGLDAHPSPSCDACLDEQCCDASLACYRAEDDCVGASQCSLDCAYDTACLGACSERYGSKAYEPLQACLLEKCLIVCLPDGACTKLVGCCQRIPNDNAARDACIKATNRNDGAGCQSLLDSRLLDPFCPELVVAPAQ